MVFGVSNALTSTDFLKHGYISYINHHACDRPIDRFRIEGADRDYGVLLLLFLLLLFDMVVIDFSITTV